MSDRKRSAPGDGQSGSAATGGGKHPRLDDSAAGGLANGPQPSGDVAQQLLKAIDNKGLTGVVEFVGLSKEDQRRALRIMQEGHSWAEVNGMVQVAQNCGYCNLPIKPTADDLKAYEANKASVAPVVAQLMMVGRHVQFSDGSRLQLFRHGDQVRVINDEPAFKLSIGRPGPAGRQHTLEHDPPAYGDIVYSTRSSRWVGGSGWGQAPIASVSAFATNKILTYFEKTHRMHRTAEKILDSRVGGGRLDALLTQSPQTSVEGCTVATTTPGDHANERWLVLTDSSHPFVAWIYIGRDSDVEFGRVGEGWRISLHNVTVEVKTTEPPASGVSRDAPFKDRFPLTTQLARVVLGQVAPFVFGQQHHYHHHHQQQQQDGGVPSGGSQQRQDEQGFTLCPSGARHKVLVEGTGNVPTLDQRIEYDESLWPDGFHTDDQTGVTIQGREVSERVSELDEYEREAFLSMREGEGDQADHQAIGRVGLLCRAAAQKHFGW
ncbi:unnamed protein product [Vitrella brassicaformis CCMP3155]|uniref:Uncharacterized protein n=1 Tax=Vitrella brassicaformis (strain CCMP3155) TaxID=1169540 RepID=A0A0G4H0K6_VITBC|nr:unnamed protein product [Vitrella brassicaformis CCMP3155]|eukprot:CEM36866.1 unnamed protein product [Vitrella brassicaformis CCMP3155]